MKMRFKPTGEIIEIEDYCGQPTVCPSTQPKYQIKNTGEFVLCSDCEMVEITSYRAPVHYDQIAHFQAKPTNLLNEKAIEVLSPNDIIINCEKITLTNNGIEINITKDLSGCKSIIINGIKFTREK